MKRALVTGGSGGIGSEICRKSALPGYHVYVHADNSLQRAEEIVAGIKDAGGSAQAIAFDVANAEQTHQALQTALAEGAIQVLVNNAGIHDDAVMPGMNAHQWRG
jgi:3-oxoacyl-[acyl-carrier protein] reductase